MVTYSVQDVLDQARSNGCEPELKEFLAFAKNHNLAIQPKKHSIMIAPAQNKSVALITIWPNVEMSKEVLPGKRPNSLYVEVSINISGHGERWSKYFGISEAMLLNVLQPSYQKLDPQVYDWANRKHYPLCKHVDSSNIRDAIDRLNKLMEQATTP